MVGGVGIDKRIVLEILSYQKGIGAVDDYLHFWYWFGDCHQCLKLRTQKGRYYPQHLPEPQSARPWPAGTLSTEAVDRLPA